MASRRDFFAVAASAGMACGFLDFAARARAHAVSKPVRLLVGFPAGGSIDTVARVVAGQLKSYAPSIVVDNRPGAGGRIALDALKGSEPDGSVILMTPSDQLTLFPHVYSQLGYDPLKDFAPVSTICSIQFLLTVGPRVSADVRTLADFVVWCREKPDLATYGTAGAGTRPHFLGVALARAAGFNFVHVAYKGNPPAIQDVLAKHVAANISTIGNTLSFVQSGILRALATSAPRRSEALPDVPTFREAGYPSAEAVEWFGILVPRRTPITVITALHDAVRVALASAELNTVLAKLSLEPVGTSPEEFAQLIKVGTVRSAELVSASGFKPLE